MTDDLENKSKKPTIPRFGPGPSIPAKITPVIGGDDRLGPDSMIIGPGKQTLPDEYIQQTIKEARNYLKQFDRTLAFRTAVLIQCDLRSQAYKDATTF